MKFSWEAPEYNFKEKTNDWFWALGIIAISATVAAFLLNNVLFGILILLGAFLLALFAAREPNTIRFEINENGIIIDKLFYPYKNLSSFYAEGDILLIKSKKKLMQLLIIPLEPEDNKVHDFLINYLEEEELEIPLSQIVMEFLGF